jgi:hypothetical protein
MYHIKQGKKYLCDKKPVKTDSYITLSAAGRATLHECCPLCKQEYNAMITSFTNNIRKWTTDVS